MSSRGDARTSVRRKIPGLSVKVSGCSQNPIQRRRNMLHVTNEDDASACVRRVIAWGPEMLLWNHGEDWIMEEGS